MNPTTTKLATSAVDPRVLFAGALIWTFLIDPERSVVG